MRSPTSRATVKEAESSSVGVSSVPKDGTLMQNFPCKRVTPVVNLAYVSTAIVNLEAIKSSVPRVTVSLVTPVTVDVNVHLVGISDDSIGVVKKPGISRTVITLVIKSSTDYTIRLVCPSTLVDRSMPVKDC